MNDVSLVADPGSFRDPSGRVYLHDGMIYRSVSHHAADNFRQVWDSGVLEAMAEKKLLIGTKRVADDMPVRRHFSDDIAFLLNHPTLPFISYPYEWGFAALKAAALAHIDLHLQLLGHGFTLSDASAYNMQFDGAHPLHIDVLSIIPYKDGSPWTGYRQFLQHFLNPLLLEAVTGEPFTALLRSMTDGIGSDTLYRLLPWHRLARPGCLLHVTLPALAERRYRRSTLQSGGTTPPHIPRARLVGMLKHLHTIIEGLAPRNPTSTWSGYTVTSSYSQPNANVKQEIVRSFVQARKPDMLLDIGCNNGEYAAMALAAGAGRVIGIDADRGALDACFDRARRNRLALTPLAIDITNPSPAQGWRNAERKALTSRLRADAITALAVLHHICIGSNVPLDDAMTYLTSLAPCGIIEFVPKSDPMVQTMLRYREDIFTDYTLAHAKACLQRHARLSGELPVGDSGRTLLVFERV